jgi:hypothetical protein
MGPANPDHASASWASFHCVLRSQAEHEPSLTSEPGLAFDAFLYVSDVFMGFIRTLTLPNAVKGC